MNGYLNERGTVLKIPSVRPKARSTNKVRERDKRGKDRKAAKREEKGGKGGVGGDIFKDYKKAARAAPFLHSLESGSEPGAFA